MWNEWYGTVNTDNVDFVAELIEKLLTGHKFTQVYCYEYKRYEPEVRLHQQLEGARDGVNVKVHHSEGHANVTICDTYGIGGFSTSRTEPGYDPEFNAPYVVIKPYEMTITDRAPNGLLYYHVCTIEDSRDDRDFIAETLQAIGADPAPAPTGGGDSGESESEEE